jgi:hypothetical protein
MPLVALCRRNFSADLITNMSEFDFRQAQAVLKLEKRTKL